MGLYGGRERVDCRLSRRICRCVEVVVMVVVLCRARVACSANLRLVCVSLGEGGKLLGAVVCEAQEECRSGGIAPTPTEEARRQWQWEQQSEKRKNIYTSRLALIELTSYDAGLRKESRGRREIVGLFAPIQKCPVHQQKICLALCSGSSHLSQAGPASLSREAWPGHGKAARPPQCWDFRG